MKRLAKTLIVIWFLFFIMKGQYVKGEVPLYVEVPPYENAKSFHSEEILKDEGLAYEFSKESINLQLGQINHKNITASYGAGVASFMVTDQIASSYFTVPVSGDYKITIKVKVMGNFWNMSNSFGPISYSKGGADFYLAVGLPGVPEANKNINIYQTDLGFGPFLKTAAIKSLWVIIDQLSVNPSKIKELSDTLNLFQSIHNFLAEYSWNEEKGNCNFTFVFKAYLEQGKEYRWIVAPISSTVSCSGGLLTI